MVGAEICSSSVTSPTEQTIFSSLLFSFSLWLNYNIKTFTATASKIFVCISSHVHKNVFKTLSCFSLYQLFNSRLIEKNKVPSSLISCGNDACKLEPPFSQVKWFPRHLYKLKQSSHWSFFFAFVLGMFLSAVIDQSSPVGKEAFSVVFLYLYPPITAMVTQIMFSEPTFSMRAPNNHG